VQAVNETRARKLPRAGSVSPKQIRTRLRLTALGLSLAVTFGTIGSAHAVGLVDAYEAALSADPIYAGAVKEKEAGEANLAIGRSYLLPNLSANYSNYRENTQTTDFQPGAGNLFTREGYRA
jgi:protease secretion system outer membrane protein